MRLLSLLVLFFSLNLKAELACRVKPFGLLTSSNLSVLNGNFNDPQTADLLIKEAIAANRITSDDSEMMFIYQNTNEYKSFRGSDTQGSMLVSGNIYLKNYSVGHSLDRASNKVLANGKIVIYPNTNYDRLGHLFTPTSIYGDHFIEEQKFPFQQESNRLLQLSKELFSLKNTGLVDRSSKAKITLMGDNYSDIQVFTVSGEQLKDIREVNFANIPREATVIINLKAPKKLAELSGFMDLGLNPRKTLFNFEPSSEYTIHIHNIEVPGTIIAPSARVFFSTGLVRGQIIAKDFIGSGQINLDPFDGCLPK